jgi:hypothetical protein
MLQPLNVDAVERRMRCARSGERRERVPLPLGGGR